MVTEEEVDVALAMDAQLEQRRLLCVRVVDDAHPDPAVPLVLNQPDLRGGTDLDGMSELAREEITQSGQARDRTPNGGRIDGPG